MSEEELPGRNRSESKSTKAGACVECWRNSKEASVMGTE